MSEPKQKPKRNKCPVCGAKASCRSAHITAGKRSLHILNQVVIKAGQRVAICTGCIEPLYAAQHVGA